MVALFCSNGFPAQSKASLEAEQIMNMMPGNPFMIEEIAKWLFVKETKN